MGSGYSRKVLRIDGSNEFILEKLRDFCKKYNIAIKYAILYIHQINCLAKKE